MSTPFLFKFHLQTEIETNFQPHILNGINYTFSVHISSRLTLQKFQSPSFDLEVHFKCNTTSFLPCYAVKLTHFPYVSTHHIQNWA